MRQHCEALLVLSNTKITVTVKDSFDLTYFKTILQLQRYTMTIQRGFSHLYGLIIASCS